MHAQPASFLSRSRTVLLARALGLLLLVWGLAQLSMVIAASTMSVNPQMTQALLRSWTSPGAMDPAMFLGAGASVFRHFPLITTLIGGALALLLPRAAIYGFFQRWGRYRYE